VDTWYRGRTALSVVIVLLFVPDVFEKTVWPIVRDTLSTISILNLNPQIVTWPDSQSIGLVF
jgi:hypothetical protein